MTSFPWRIFFTICALSTTPRVTSSSSLKLKDNVLLTAIDHSNDEKMSNHFDRVVSAAQQFTAPTLSAVSTTPEIPTATKEKTADTVPLISTLEESNSTIQTANPTLKPTPSPSFKPVIAIATIAQDFLLTNVSAIASNKDKQYKSFASSSEVFVFTALQLASTEKVFYQSFTNTVRSSSPSMAPTSSVMSVRMSLTYKVVSTNGKTYQEISDLAFLAATNQAYDLAISAKKFNFGATATGTPYAAASISTPGTGGAPTSAPVSASRTNDSLVTPYWAFLSFILVPFFVCCCFCKAGYRCKKQQNSSVLGKQVLQEPGYAYPPAI